MFSSNETLNIDSDIETGNSVIILSYAFVTFCGSVVRVRTAPVC
jgi:hypothetical protein